MVAIPNSEVEAILDAKSQKTQFAAATARVSIKRAKP
jgi:hypothetical protein